jgi:hypothetical protein
LTCDAGLTVRGPCGFRRGNDRAGVSIVPKPAENERLLKIEAASINPVDYKIRAVCAAAMHGVRTPER